MKILRLTSVLLLVIASAGCKMGRNTTSNGSQLLTPSDAAGVVQAVRTFTATVALDVTQEGPLAWGKFFELQQRMESRMLLSPLSILS